MFPILQWSKEPPPKPHLKHQSQLQMIAEGDQSEFPSQASQSPLHHSSVPEVLWDRATRDSNLPWKHWHWDMNQLWEAFTPKDCETSHQYTWCQIPQEMSHTTEASKKRQTSESLHSHQKADEQLNGYSFSPCMSCTARVALDHLSLPWASPEWSMDNPYSLSYFIFFTTSATGTETWLE